MSGHCLDKFSSSSNVVPDPLATLTQPMAAIVQLDKKQRILGENLAKSGSTTFFKSQFRTIVSILLNFEKKYMLCPVFPDVPFSRRRL